MKKNILFIFDMFPGIGGVEIVSNNIIDYLSEFFSIYTLSRYSQKNVYVSPHIIEMFNIEETLDQDKCILQLNSIIKEKNIDLIINQGLYPEVTDLIFNTKFDKSVKIYSFLHGMPKYEEKLFWQIPYIANTSWFKLLKRKFLSKFGLCRQYKSYIKKYEQAYYKACTYGEKVILLCDEYVPIFIKKYNLDKFQEKVTAIENPLSSHFSTRNVTEWTTKKNKIIFVGRLSEEKRVDIILEVWKNIEALNDWELIIIGNGNLYSKLKNTTEKKQIQRVTFTGQVDNPQDYYKEAKIILLTSDFEGFPMCLIEAQRFGVTPLVFNISEGVHSIIKDGGGILIKHRNKKNMSKKILELINDEKKLKTLSEKVRKKSDRYTINEIGKQWICLLNK